MSKLSDIVNGWKNVIFEDPEVEIIALERAKICAGCPININNICNKEAGGCGCPLIAATRSVNKKCPQSKWLR